MMTQRYTLELQMIEFISVNRIQGAQSLSTSAALPYTHVGYN